MSDSILQTKKMFDRFASYMFMGRFPRKRRSSQRERLDFFKTIREHILLDFLRLP